MTSWFRHNSEEWSALFSIPNMKLDRISASFPVKILLQNILRVSKKSQIFKQLFAIYSISLQSFIERFSCYSCSLMVWKWLQVKGQFPMNVRKKEMYGIFAWIFHVSFIFVSSYEKSLKFNLLYKSKFRFDRVHGKMVNDTHLKES